MLTQKEAVRLVKAWETSKSVAEAAYHLYRPAPVVNRLAGFLRGEGVKLKQLPDNPNRN